ncbi:GNAT superfamily N-acetyltransferase [Arthrobacter globiformis]|uniref:GNAT family N-acetyltransferase n=1 Tax=Arthrobacter globiformis TaxID=1665 RepID=UPI002784FD7A|nr:GNAT family N-acetyltransferase [Arthrobacter globiformis]MDQ1058581.1 GNAT superfamily N-acetyltransferase [Arthrobacter globiformis]
MIREARAKDLPKMRDIEVAAGEAFRTIGMGAIADEAPPSLEALAVYQQNARAWVATDSGDEAVAYILVDVVGPFAHIEQVTVHPLYARQAIGRRLIDEAALWAAARGLKGMTLTTFERVPWNAPYYARLGFQPVPEYQWSDGLRQIVQSERSQGLDAWPRVIMKMDLPGE